MGVSNAPNIPYQQACIMGTSHDATASISYCSMIWSPNLRRRLPGLKGEYVTRLHLNPTRKFRKDLNPDLVQRVGFCVYMPSLFQFPIYIFQSVFLLYW